MAERLTPGVYVEEVSSGARPIQGVGTSTAGFIGETARGIPNRATFVRGFADFERVFGGHRRGAAGLPAQAVEAFFRNGGRRMFFVRVLASDATPGASAGVVARSEDVWGIAQPVLAFVAKGEGAWSQYLRIHIEPASTAPGEAFQVRVEWTENGQSRTLERFDDVRMDPEREDYVVTTIEAASRYVEAIDLLQRDFLDLAGAERERPPFPERVAALDSSDAPATGDYLIPENAVLQFRWTDDHVESPAQVVFDNATVTAVGGDFASGEAALTAMELRDLLQTALGAEFRVSVPAGPAEVLSEDGPWDTSAASQSVVRVDGADTALVYAATTPAQIDLGAGTFAVSAGDTIELIVDGGAVQGYTLLAGDVSDGAATVGELVAVVNREFTGIQALDAAGSLLVRTDTLGPSASLTIQGTANLGGPAPAAGDGNVADPGAVTAEELADIFNLALSAAPFEARVEGAAVRLVQTDLSASATIRWVSDPGPDAIFADTTEHAGPAPSPTPNVRVEPAVASRAYLALQVPVGSEVFAFGATSTVTLTATDGATPSSFVVDVAADGDLTPGTLRDRIAAQIDPTQNPYDVEVEEAGEYVVLTAGPNAGGVSLTATVDAGVPWRAPRAVAGEAGAVVESQSTVTLTVGEVLQIGVGRALQDLFPTARASGYDQNSPRLPGLRPEESGDDPIQLVGGDDGQGTVGVSDFQGSATDGSGLHAFDTVEINLLALPGRTEPGFLSAAMAYCDANDVFFIADGPGSVDRDFRMTSAEVKQYYEGLPTRIDSGAMYYPWLSIADPNGISRNARRFVPPSGLVAGVFARTDTRRGVWKAPAGIEASVIGALDLQHQMTDADQDLLNPIGLSCIRQFPGTGIVVWGSRTLSSDPEWRYVPVRRTALFLKASLRRGLRWAVFEPNDQELWDRMRINVTAFMLGLFRQGAFQGATPEEAFLVKCDRETNPQVNVDQGMVTIEVGFAPLKPAEFVIVRLSQMTQVA